MGKVTITLTMVSTVVLLITFGKGMGILRGGDVASHLYWAMATLISVLAANFVAIVHAAQSDRIIRELRRAIPGGDAAPDAGLPPA
jgi:hypothetical protein